MTIPEIRALRDGGEIIDAYNECKSLLDACPIDRATRIEAAWCLKTLSEQAVKSRDRVRIGVCLDELRTLKLEELGETFMHDRFCWDVAMLMNAARDNPAEHIRTAENMFDRLKRLPFVKQNRYYSMLVEAFSRVRNGQDVMWLGFTDFMDWWGFDNLTPDDFQRIATSTPGRTIVSVAERAYTAYYKSLMAQIDGGKRNVGRIEAFIKRLDTLAAMHGEFAYTLYHKALLLLKLGRKDDALEAMRPFVKKKQNDFWVWDVLAETTDDDAIKMSCYCRSLLCRADQKFLGNVRRKLADLLHKSGDDARAKCEIERIVETYRREGWRIPAAIADVARQGWFAEVQSAGDNRQFYSEHLAESEHFIFMDTPEVAIMISRYNREKNICNFVTADRRRGFFFSKGIRGMQFREYQILHARFAGDLQPDAPVKIVTVKPAPNAAEYANILYRKTEGVLRLRDGATYGFVDDIFVDTPLLPGIANGTHVSVAAVLSHSPRRNAWSWKAIRVTSR